MILPNLPHYAALMRLDKPIGFFLLLWPTWLALLVASDGRPEPKIVVIFTLGVFLMRAAGCVINDVADRKFDSFVTRTKNRPLACGSLSTKNALSLFGLLVLMAWSLVWMLDPLTISLAFLALGLAVIYPFMKRFTFYPQIVLGLAFSWSIPMAFSAVQQRLTLEIAWWFLATVCWIVAYDTQYAMTDKKDDQALGLKSTAIVFGRHDRLIIGLLQSSFLLSLVILGQWKEFSKWYFFGLFFAGFCLIYQQYLLKDRDPAKCFKAFLNNNYVGALIFFGLALHYILD